jgi:very-short-patch-repair endonuclease
VVAQVTRSALEDRFWDVVVAHALPAPRRNWIVTVGTRAHEVDVAWPAARLAVELDGRAFHDTASAFESDRARDRALAVAGWRVVRVTWRHLRDDPGAVVDDLRRLLSRGVV